MGTRKRRGGINTQNAIYNLTYPLGVVGRTISRAYYDYERRKSFQAKEEMKVASPLKPRRSHESAERRKKKILVYGSNRFTSYLKGYQVDNNPHSTHFDARRYDLVIYDLMQEERYNADKAHSPSDETPFIDINMSTVKRHARRRHFACYVMDKSFYSKNQGVWGQNWHMTTTYYLFFLPHMRLLSEIMPIIVDICVQKTLLEDLDDLQIFYFLIQKGCQIYYKQNDDFNNITDFLRGGI